MDQVSWGNGVVEVTLDLAADAPVTMNSLGLAGGPGHPSRRPQPLVEVLVLGEGHALSNVRFTHTGVGSRLRYEGHDIDGDTLRVRQTDARTALTVTTTIRARPGVAALQFETRVHNGGAAGVVLQLVSSFASGAFLRPAEQPADVVLWRARSEWCAEGRWARQPIGGPDGLPSINTAIPNHTARGTLATVSTSTWSSGTWLPTGILENEATGRAWAWQVEHNGAWHWEVDTWFDGDSALGVVVAGPNDLDHQWSHLLAPGAEFTSIPVSVAVSNDGWQGAIAALTGQRRAMRRTSGADARLPVIFNDYMNALMGDPTTEKLLPLVDAAAEVGAEIFCVDAGWYDDGGAWWPSVGEWQPSTVRFAEGGLERVLDHIRAKGMLPGLWLEPEVIGVRSPVADRLPEEAFLQRYGRRVVEHDRYHLDLRHPAARAHLDEVVDRLVGEYGARYFKLDYNVTPGVGTDIDAFSAGAGLLEHNRAHLEWLDGLVARHPEVIFENCASGAMRMDYAMMSRLDLQSTSDQQDHRLYSAIAASAPASLVPEQAGNWAYPQSGMSPEEIAYNLVNGLAGRVYLSGHRNLMTPDEFALVAEGVAAHKAMRDDLARSVPFWPLGLPAWTDDSLALGLAAPDVAYLAVWQRGSDPAPVTLRLPQLAGRGYTVRTAYPRDLPDWRPEWDDASGVLRLTPKGPGPVARLLRFGAPTS